MKYTKIKSMEQYSKYCDLHEKFAYKNYSQHEEEIELLEILIDEYENRTIPMKKSLDPVEVLAYLLEVNDLSKSQLAREVQVSRQLITDILNYRRDISKSMILKLSKRFRLNPSVFTKEYKLKPNRRSRKSA